MAELDDNHVAHERKFDILSAIVEEYVLTGEPIGSKRVAELLENNFSSATIRNDMMSLEKLGLLEQPHTSAGRVPSYSGYRMYIEKLMNPKPIAESEREFIDRILSTHNTSRAELLTTAADALATITGCATIARANIPKFSLITRVEVIPAGYRLYALLMITSSGQVKNKVCRLEFDLNEDTLEFFMGFLQENLYGVDVESLDDDYMKKISLSLGTYMMTLSPLLNAVCELSGEMIDDNVDLHGEANLLNYKDVDATEIVRFLSTKNQLSGIFDEAFGGLNIIFGKEQQDFPLSNGSMIISNYMVDGNPTGTLGLVGPVRLDYAKFIPYIEYFSDRISEMLTCIDDRKEDL